MEGLHNLVGRKSDTKELEVIEQDGRKIKLSGFPKKHFPGRIYANGKFVGDPSKEWIKVPASVTGNLIIYWDVAGKNPAFTDMKGTRWTNRTTLWVGKDKQ